VAVKKLQVLGVKEPARRTRKAKAPRQREILAAAFEEFAANGYAAARLDNVARRAKIAKGTIYLYFPSKSRLFQAVVRSLIRPVPEDFDSLVMGSSKSACQLLGDLISRQYSEVVAKRKARAILRLLIAESGRFPELSDLYHREVIQPGARALRLLLEKGIASGEFRETGVTAFPQILAAPIVLAIVWNLILGARANLDLDAYRAAHVEFILRGLRAPAAQSGEAGAALAGVPDPAKQNYPKYLGGATNESPMEPLGKR
jgi:AcrR family transcriptional regulator